jgi:hypothetical protein
MGVRSNISRRGLFRMTLQTFLLNRAIALPVVDAHPLDVDRIAGRKVSGDPHRACPALSCKSVRKPALDSHILPG